MKHYTGRMRLLAIKPDDETDRPYLRLNHGWGLRLNHGWGLQEAVVLQQEVEVSGTDENQWEDVPLVEDPFVTNQGGEG